MCDSDQNVHFGIFEQLTTTTWKQSMAKRPNKQKFQNTISSTMLLSSRISSVLENKGFSPRKKMAKK